MAVTRLAGGLAAIMLLAAPTSVWAASTDSADTTVSVASTTQEAAVVTVPIPKPAPPRPATTFTPRGGASASACRHIEFVRVVGFCTVEDGCKTGKGGQYIYQARVRNDSDAKQYIAYHFDRPDGAYIKGGFALEPRSDITRPIGMGTVEMPEEADHSSARRIRVTECGADARIRYRWNAR